MITPVGSFEVKYRGLSTDEKPMDVPNGSGIFEMDSGKYFYFDEENKKWLIPGESSSDSEGEPV